MSKSQQQPSTRKAVQQEYRDFMEMETLVQKAFARLHQYVEKEQYRGYEFDDFLASPLCRLLSFGNVFLKRVWIQVGERLPINIRPLIGIPKLESTKARGFFAKGALWQYQRSGDPQWLAIAERHLEWLMQNPSTGYPGISWGNHFDFASRGGFFPKGLPTIVWTAHIAESFDLAYQLTGKAQYREVVIQAAQFIVEGLERHSDENGICFAYAPGILNLIHNSNLLGAATLLRAWRYTGDPAQHRLAQQAYQWTIAHMHPDGSWYYGAEPKYRWIDNFHTAYNIDCLMTAVQIVGEEFFPFSIVERAYAFWVKHFFEEDGTPWYYHNRKYPLDIQCAAQAIETFAKLWEVFPDALKRGIAVARWTIRNMQKSNGAFRYRRLRFWRNDLEPIHWGEATMYAALSALLLALQRAHSGKGEMI